MSTLGVISDMDGVIYRGKRVIPGAQHFIDRLRASGAGLVFLTNNSEQTPLDLLRKLAGLDIHGLTEANFITSAMATAEFLAAQKPTAQPMSSVAVHCLRRCTTSVTRSPRLTPITWWSARLPLSDFRCCVRQRS